jgi:4-amino-4-deoxy-L-arabinose transferase-like glycosyltransferase
MLRMEPSARKPGPISRVLLDRPAFSLAVVVLVALAVRLLYFAGLSDNPWFHYTINDERIYDRIAKLLVAGEPGWSEAFYQPPGYAVFLSFLYAATGRELASVRLAQLLLGVLNAALLYGIGRRVFGPGVGFVAALLFAFYAPMFFFEGMLLPPVLVVFFNLAFFLALLRCVERPRWWRGLATGALMGASAATMSIVLPFAAVVLVLGGRQLVVQADGLRARRRALFSVGSAFLLGLGVVVGACTLHNWVVAEKLVLISDNFGINFYLGTGADFERKVAIRPGKEWAQLNMAPVRAGRGDDRSGYFVERSLQIIRSDPAAYAESLVRKVFLFAHGHELKRNQELYPFRRYSPVLAGLLWKAGVAWPWGILFPFAVLGMVHATREKNFGVGLLILFCVSHVLLLLPFFMAARYRMNVVPFLLLFAVYGGSVLAHAVRVRDRRTAGGCVLVLIVFLALSNWQVGEMAQYPDAHQYRSLAQDLRHEGRKREAWMLMAESRRATHPPDPGEATPLRISTLLVGAGVLALLGYRRVTAKAPLGNGASARQTESP